LRETDDLLRLRADGPVQVLRQPHHHEGDVKLADHLSYLCNVLSLGTAGSIDLQTLRYGAARIGKGQANPLFSDVKGQYTHCRKYSTPSPAVQWEKRGRLDTAIRARSRGRHRARVPSGCPKGPHNRGRRDT